MQQGDQIYEYNYAGQIIDRHDVWAVTEKHVTLGTIKSNGTRIKLALPVRADGSLTEMVFRRGRKKSRFFVRSKQTDNDFLIWQLKEHITKFISDTKNVKLLKKIYHETRAYTKAQTEEKSDKVDT